MKKYELTDEYVGLRGDEYVGLHGVKSFRIRALKDFDDVCEGDLGGFVHSERNLSHDGNSWIYGNAKVCGDAHVGECAKVYGNAYIYNNAKVYGDAIVRGNAVIGDSAEIYGNAEVHGHVWVHGNAKIYDDAEVGGNAKVYGDAKVCENAMVYGNAKVGGNAKVYDYAEVYGDTHICGDAMICNEGDYATIKGLGTKFRNTTFFRCENNQIKVVCGCFRGTINEFRKQVEITRSGKIAEEYLKLADLMEFHFKK